MTKIYFATNRNPNRKHDPDAFGGRFNPEAVDNLRFGVAEVTGHGAAGSIQSITVAPERLSRQPSRARLGSRQVFDELRASMHSGIDTLCFVHGYNVDFEEAILAGNGLHEDYAGTDGLNVVVFTWPSDGSMMPFLAYKSDRTDAAASGPAFARALIKLQDFLAGIQRGEECRARLDLLCHSMGNYVLRHGIQATRRTISRIPQVFDDIFLMAADEDYDAFEYDYKLGPLPELGKHVHVYYNRGDTALVVSDKTKSNPTRLGSRGPRAPLSVPGNVSIVDASEVVSGLIEHSYYLDNEQTIRDVRSVRSGVPPDRIAMRRYVPSQNTYVLED